MSSAVQVCWEKFANYFEVEPRLVPMSGDRFHLTGEEAVKLERAGWPERRRPPERKTRSRRR